MSLFLLSSCTPSSSPTRPVIASRAQGAEQLAELFARPLITGASVSANWSTASPGRRAALRYTAAENIRTQAQGGRAGRATVLKLSKEDFATSSLVIALDLFFWDSVFGDFATSQRALKTVISWSADTGTPLVLGDIPALLPGRQANRERLNREIHRLCQKTPSCIVWEADTLHQQVMRDGYLTIKGRRYTLRELIPDGLHVKEVASEHLADTIEGLLTK